MGLVIEDGLQDFLGCVGIAEKVGEADGVVDKLAVGGGDAVVVGVGYDASPVVDYFYPFGFGSQYDAGLFKEESLFLHPTAVGHDEVCVLLQHGDVEEAGRWYDGD